ncbi:Multidrug resistance efflux pump, MFP-family [Cupriavidus necator]|uniref:Multidrug resistance efflux pump, MFP-family n=1 Tax=Cupriavidus necator (strain ATCC 17699 / DSM 428 / KCTC 22496 / NCIMB 10442 / H16 / Stanier 337) TaxID=381666 RepID=Q0K9R0_CUPNH|nr:efflux RND transporter periplasmic adaptor subunit [Cupriavidus necator]QQB76102.1 efflux RND transporter periplasmic adaptor subunit [Cupriavidus necator]WKA39451.1 efflux RND transporter periplasmic adaptor subunit [Cupriavidus necator]CAJ93261.1 multidrug resistance efflux pump, MFP-family [Cupriavidus necator H16]
MPAFSLTSYLLAALGPYARRLWFAAAALCVLALGTLGLVRRSQSDAPPPPPPPVPVRVARVEARDVARQAESVGTVRPLRDVVVRTQIDGQLMRLHVREGQQVARGELLASLDDRPIQAALGQARATLAMNLAQLRAAELDLGRYRTLIAADAIPRQTLDQQLATVEQLRATVQGNRAAIVAEEVRLSYTRIRSPIAGRIGLRNVDEGNLVRVGDADGIFTVTQLSPITVEFTMPQSALPVLQHLSAGGANAAVHAHARDGGAPLAQGRLLVIDSRVGTGNGAVRVKAEFDNRAGELWPGQFVAVRLHTGLLRDALVARPAVLRYGEQDQPYVFRVRPDNTVEIVPVSVRYQDRQQVVLEGVAAGDQLVSDGQSRLRAGSRVSVPIATPAPRA